MKLAELDKESPSRETIRINFRVLETVENQLRNVNSQIMNLMVEDETITPHDLEREQDMVVQYGKNFIRTELRVAEYLQLKKNEHQGRSNLDPTRSAQEGMSSYKLPKMALTVYEGTCLEWLGWWSQFKTIHESPGLSEVEKLQYLVQSMRAGTQADRLPLTTANYPKVVKALQDRFGDKVILTEVYVRQLLKLVINNARKNTLTLESFVRPGLIPFKSLEINGRHYTTECLIFVPPSGVKSAGRLVEDMAKKCASGGRVTPLCLICKGKHWIQDCAGWRSMTVTKRMDEIRKFNVCFRCLRVGHMRATCRTQIRCLYCRGPHHIALHLPRQIFTAPTVPEVVSLRLNQIPSGAKIQSRVIRFCIMSSMHKSSGLTTPGESMLNRWYPVRIRGVLGSMIGISRLCWKGPNWVISSRDQWPKMPTISGRPEIFMALSVGLLDQVPLLVALGERFSSITTYNRVVAWILRFIINCRGGKVQSPLNPVEI
ncbi:hypothetical protein LAZ67_23000906 [Cordylochernes scorpioides]|uniref:CCHC-type domain-containing protein n=1 Tax=Cordylochernes scorpioides TaxID=51811 RepID=A0ABY6LQP4_9ARAC|nr:hypothetical protein LAZ67_23000906 [Cordylochernes scorpioides]